jgi:hypothetical protein
MTAGTVFRWIYPTGRSSGSSASWRVQATALHQEKLEAIAQTIHDVLEEVKQ